MICNGKFTKRISSLNKSNIILPSIILLLTILALFMTMHFQTYQPYLNSDELSGIQRASSNHFYGDVHPPLGYLIQKLIDSFLKTKLDYILFNLLILFPLFAFIVLKLNKLVFRNYSMGYISLFVLLSNPGVLYYEIGSARIFYFLFSVFNLLVIYFFIKYLNSYKTKDLILFVILTILSIYTSTLGIVTCFVLGLIFLALQFIKKNLKGIINGGGMFIFFFLISIPVIYSVISIPGTSIKIPGHPWYTFGGVMLLNFVLTTAILVIVSCLLIYFILIQKRKLNTSENQTILLSYTHGIIIFNFFVLTNLVYVTSIERAFSYMFIFFYLAIFNISYILFFNKYPSSKITLWIILSIVAILLISANVLWFKYVKEDFNSMHGEIDDITSHINLTRTTNIFYYDDGGNSYILDYSLNKRYNFTPTIYTLAYGNGTNLYPKYPDGYDMNFVNLPNLTEYYLILGKFAFSEPLNITRFNFNCTFIVKEDRSLTLYLCTK